MPRQLGHPKTGGREAGTPNKITGDVKAAAQQYTVRAIRKLWAIATDPKQPGQVQINAITELLSRGHGKPAQPITAPEGGNAAVGVITLRWLDSSDDEVSSAPPKVIDHEPSNEY